VGITLHKKTTDLVAFSAWVLASLLLSPNGSSYSLILLLIPLLALVSADTLFFKPVYLYTAMALVFLIAAIPVQGVAQWPLLLQFPRLYLLLLLFVMMLLVTGMRWPAKPFLLFAGLLLLADAGKLLGQKRDVSQYLLPDELPLLYAYAINNDQLVYYYWDDKGSHTTATGYPVQAFTTDHVRIQNNQVFYNDQQLTNTPDRKKQVMLINGKEIIYLSDKNRGFGFCALRKISAPTLR
jgi:hypothetical protein